jgi:(E)-4-hydroxy-3-methylbut-2-enyl-diphosphate synthase
MYNYIRRKSTECHVGNVVIGGEHPICVQSMTNTNTNDVEASVAQIERIVDAGADIVRLTAQGTREALALREIEAGIHRDGYNVPLVADIHFNAAVADVAAEIVEKVRINPGNYVDPGRSFKKLEYTDEEYAQEIEKIRRRLIPFLNICKAHHTAIRLGVNHGSLSDRIMSRYGDTPAGMVESCMEFLRICVEQEFTDVVISIKASNTSVMVRTVRLLVQEMDRENMHFPLHLGVTEAGDAEDGRIKSAVGIGALLADGIGDTIRVSLSEDPEAEIPVARALVKYFEERALHKPLDGPAVETSLYNPIDPQRFHTTRVGKLGDGQPVCVCGGTAFGADVCIAGMLNYSLDELNTDSSIIEYLLDHPDTPVIARANNHNPVGAWRAFIFGIRQLGCTNPVIISRDYTFCQTWEDVQLCAAADFGVMLIDKLVDGIIIHHTDFPLQKRVELAFNILQAARARFTKTEYISCPSCGRTLFDLKTTLARIKEATRELKGLKIGVMGCIVNGPGEMADADYGYVGAGPGLVSLYKGKQCVQKGIPADEAVQRLLDFIREDQQKV